MTYRAFVRRHALAMILVGTALFTADAGLVAAHVLSIRTVRDVGFPIAAAVEPLVRRKVTLTEQADVASLQSQTSGTAYRELYELYVLPDQPDLPRTLQILERLLTYLQSEGIVQSIDVLEAQERPEGAAYDDVSVSLTVEAGKSEAVLNLLDLSGVLTVSDAFTPAERDALLVLTERENPATIAALEQFLAGDLLQYAQSPVRFESQLLKSVGTELFEADFRAVVGMSGLKEYADVALILANEDAQKSLWPLPLLTTTKVHLERGSESEKLSVLLRAHSRRSIETDGEGLEFLTE